MYFLFVGRNLSSVPIPSIGNRWLQSYIRTWNRIIRTSPTLFGLPALSAGNHSHLTCNHKEAVTKTVSLMRIYLPLEIADSSLVRISCILDRSFDLGKIYAVQSMFSVLQPFSHPCCSICRHPSPIGIPFLYFCLFRFLFLFGFSLIFLQFSLFVKI